jgi:ribosomal protein L37AE/L43A
MGQVERHEHVPGCCPGRHQVPAGSPCPARQPVWCLACQDRIAQALLHLPEQLVDVMDLGGGRLAPRRGSGDRESRDHRTWAASPSPAADEVDAALQWVSRLEDRLRQHLGHPSPRDRRRMSVTTSIGYLLRYRTALLCWDTRVPASPGGELDGPAEAEVVGQQALSLARHLERASGRDRLVHRLVAPCPRCDARTLIRRDGDDQVQCRSCGNAWSEDHYQLLVRILTEEEVSR